MAASDPIRFCSACGVEAPRSAHYCLSCGAPLDTQVGIACPACQTNNPDRARFCLGCGACLASVADADRRIVTVIFADLSGFTQLTEQLDPEEVRETVVSCLNLMSECIIRWGGYVDKFIGDCVMGVFGAPVAYENEEERAVRAALDMQSSLAEWQVESVVKSSALGDYRPQVSIGINSGPVVAGLFAAGGARDYTVIGDTVNVASRLQGLCEPGRILVGPMTSEQTRHLIEYEEEQALDIRGRREPVVARHVIGARAQRGKTRGFGEEQPPMVGRTAELARLTELWKHMSSGLFQSCLIVGPAGIGKTRLVEELVTSQQIDTEDLAGGRSYPYASSAPWEPIAELVCDLYHVPTDLHPSEAATRIAATFGEVWPQEELGALKVLLGSPISDVHELQHHGVGERRDWIASALRRCLISAADRPRLLVLEDLHWADSTTLDFLCTLPELELDAPIMAVMVTRPPLPGESLVGKLIDATTQLIVLQPLDAEQARELVDTVLGPHELPPDLVELIVERAEGNPLFIEETLKSLGENGSIEQVDEKWRAKGDIADIQLPETIESVLTTRIDGLDSSTRQVLQLASIVGRRFWSGVLADALAQRSIDRELVDLQKSAFVRALPYSSVSGNREFMFEHLMLQEVAYEGMLRGMRTELHGAVARWFEEQPASQRGEYDELIAYHRERSEQPASAVPFLERAALAARGRGALLDAASLLERAINLATDPAMRAGVLVVVEEVAAEAGDSERRASAIDELESIAGADSDDRVGAEAAYRRARLLRDEGDLQAALPKAQLALELYTKLDDISYQGDALRLLGRIAHLWGDFPEALRCYRSSLPLERQAGDRQGQAEIFDLLGLAQVDLGHYTTGLDYFEAALDLFSELGNRIMEARVQGHRANALCLLGRYDEAVKSARAGLELASHSGSRPIRAGTQLALANALSARGEAEEAAAVAADARDQATEIGQPRLAARAILLMALNSYGELSKQNTREARALAKEHALPHVEVLSLAHEANLELVDGNIEAAERASAEATKMLDEHGSIEGQEEFVLFVRARVLQALERHDESSEFLGRARTIVLNRAGRIDDTEIQQSFLEHIPLNRQILSMEVPP